MAGPSVLTISSLVAAGPVGNSAIVPVLHHLGVEAIAIPTLIQSNHPGHGPFTRLTVPPDTITRMAADLQANGFLANMPVVLTGFFADAAQVEAVAALIAALRRELPPFYYLCDPVMGDIDSGLYVKGAVAQAVRDLLLPLANGLTPNAFELGWIAGRPATTVEEAAAIAAERFPEKDLVATSLGQPPDEIITAAFSAAGRTVVARPRHGRLLNGTGDILAGSLAGRLALGQSIAEALEPAVKTVERCFPRDGKSMDLPALYRSGSNT